ncbi:phage integrase SAM-like domain-containing protein [Bacteroides thetaiotaomicron]|uniref:phage integrase SAM-like domain-containing protein n=1 Tax=Barnesiella intestinihominis TaxID=487174 RepID=UPI001F5D6CDA|nr:phage integrase SAM-like domain-containing protein [Bacteroides thetaiotaomicron]MCS3094356.1 phage integrase SAM-like domain-containing protein [Bacteroides thetaiotaomicron]MDC2172639.1 phage integrase SAM-like domain-containing protein [Bacteroides thetaiotaomicron]MDC2187867.1 phage integrase SAM-like domain-containing protein [Bacteroides thetaiotaomicron]
MRRNPSYSQSTYHNYCSTVNIIKEYLQYRHRPRYQMSKIDKKFITGLLDFMQNTYRNMKSPDNPKEMLQRTLHLH